MFNSKNARFIFSIVLLAAAVIGCDMEGENQELALSNGDNHAIFQFDRSAHLAVGTQSTLTITQRSVRAESALEDLEVSSSDSSIIDVIEVKGNTVRVKAIKSGMAMISVASSGLQDRFTLHAHETAKVEFEGGLDQPKILAGSTTHYRIYRYDNQGQALSGTGPVTAKSSNPNIAQIVANDDDVNDGFSVAFQKPGTVELSIGNDTIKKTVVTVDDIAQITSTEFGSSEPNGTRSDIMAIEALTRDQRPIGGIQPHLVVSVSDEKACEAITGEFLATPLVIVKGDGSTDCAVTVTLGAHSLERIFPAQPE